MRALWSRATQIPGTYRCISCVSKNTGLSRPRGIKDLPGSRAFVTPTSTFLYTTVFAVGLSIDARAKLDRNKQWETAFEQLRGALEDPSETVAKVPTAKAPGHASPYDTPDRLTARLGLRELQALAPAREWRLVEIDVAAEEYEAALPFVRGCMEPCDSVVSSL